MHLSSPCTCIYVHLLISMKTCACSKLCVYSFISNFLCTQNYMSSYLFELESYEKECMSRRSYQLKTNWRELHLFDFFVKSVNRANSMLVFMHEDHESITCFITVFDLVVLRTCMQKTIIFLNWYWLLHNIVYVTKIVNASAALKESKVKKII